jgi:hypothetical protein
MADGEVLPFEFAGGDLRAAVLAHPVPDVWLTFSRSKESPRLGVKAPKESGIR